MPIDKQSIRIIDFSGGLNTFNKSDKILDNQLAEVLNCQPVGPGLGPRGGTVDFQTGDSTWTDRVSSIASLNDHTNGHAIVVTEASQLRRYTGSATWVGIKGALTLPTDTLWSWVQFNDVTLGGVLIGVNRGTGSNDNPVVIKNASSNAVALGGTPPKGRYIAAINQRVFIVPEELPDQVDFCSLGNVEDWTTTTAGIAAGTIVIGDNVLGDITGIVPYRESLIVFFATKTYEIQFSGTSLSAAAGGDPLATNETIWQVNVISEKVGCLSMRSVQEVMGDLIFLSGHGIISLQGLLVTGEQDITSAILSGNIKELNGLSVSHDNFCSEVIPGKSQYIISGKLSGTGDNDFCYIMDFDGLSKQTGPIAWYRFDGDMIGESYLSTIDFNNEHVLFIGSAKPAGTAKLFKYILTEVQDDGNDFIVRIKSKTFDFGVPLLRKKFYKVGSSITALDAVANLVFGYTLDSQEELRDKVFNLTFNPVQVGVALYGTAIYGTDTYGTRLDISADFKMKVSGVGGRLAKQIQLFLIRSTDTNFILNSFVIDLSVQSDKYITSSDVQLSIS